jgi:hypothetical protein
VNGGVAGILVTRVGLGRGAETQAAKPAYGAFKVTKTVTALPLDGRSPRRAHLARSGRAASKRTVARASQARGARFGLKNILV